MRDDEHMHADYHTLKLVRVWYDSDFNITSYDLDTDVKQDTSLSIISEIALMAEALNEPIMSKILLDSKVLSYKMKNINAN